LLVNDSSAECDVSQEIKNYHEIIHYGAIGMKETIQDSAIGIKGGFVSHRFFTNQESRK